MKHEPTMRVIKIIDLVSFNSDRGITIKEMMEKLDMPKTTVFNIVRTLVMEKMLKEVKDHNVIKYQLGFYTYVMASRYAEKLDVLKMAAPILKDLSDVTGLTSFVGKVNDQNIYYLYKYEPKDALPTKSLVNNANYIHSTALGKAYLSTLNDKELNKIVQTIDYHISTKFSIKDSKALLEDIKETKIHGYSIDKEETDIGLICYGAPIIDNQGQFIASISLSGIKTPKDMSDLYGKLVKQAADKISELLK